MTNSQRQQLLYFATGSSAMPVQNDGGIHGEYIGSLLSAVCCLLFIAS